MKIKSVLTGLIGFVVGIGGYYLLGRSPAQARHIVQATTPTNVGLMFMQAVAANDVYAAKSLMVPGVGHDLTPMALQHLRAWLPQKDGTGIATYEVLTFSDHKELKLEIVPSLTGRPQLWQVEKIIGQNVEVEPKGVMSLAKP